MDLAPNLKIWKYMDLAKFVSLLTTKSLYFACPSQFNDPYEGCVPRSHSQAESGIVQPLVDDWLRLRTAFADKGPECLKKFDESLQSFKTQVFQARKKAASKFGVSCWHISDHESEAMWRLYSALGQGIAIESSVGQLEASLGKRANLQIDSVRYSDFDKDPIEKGHRHYGLFMKRKSYEHEKELRATILLLREGEGILVQCDLATLVTEVHVSPYTERYVKDAVEKLCKGEAHVLRKPVLQSHLLDHPDYGTEVDLGSAS